MFNFNIYFAAGSVPPSFIDSSSSIPCSILPGSRFNSKGSCPFGSLNPEIWKKKLTIFQNLQRQISGGNRHYVYVYSYLGVQFLRIKQRRITKTSPKFCSNFAYRGLQNQKQENSLQLCDGFAEQKLYENTGWKKYGVNPARYFISVIFAAMQKPLVNPFCETVGRILQDGDNLLLNLYKIF